MQRFIMYYIGFQTLVNLCKFRLENNCKFKLSSSCFIFSVSCFFDSCYFWLR
ncbi:hypothetical protein HanXRQr2_Chr14g0655921 [Helianthus annuus]|uniref:Uncharacterized protein n=1 Tax=Helianthus annuus TaxID=4232 RepID=A0A9K3ECU3_HELAN|nr:hypothetical protein HanXRQr2_Chr14g0655921 [Helianthus annuus]